MKKSVNLSGAGFRNSAKVSVCDAEFCSGGFDHLILFIYWTARPNIFDYKKAIYIYRITLTTRKMNHSLSLNVFGRCSHL